MGQRELHKLIKNKKDYKAIFRCLKEKSCSATGSSLGYYPLHVAARFNPYPDVCLLLLQRGAKLEQQGDLPYSKDEAAWKNIRGRPIHLAAGWNSQEVVSALLEKGALTEVNDSTGSTALHYAALQNPRAEVAHLLTQKGADIRAKDHAGQTPLHKAAANNTVEVGAVLLKRGGQVDARDYNGCTPLHAAAKGPAVKLDMIGFLIENGADVQAADQTGATPLHKAAQGNRKAVVNAFLEQGAALNARAGCGSTPLHFAVASNSNPEMSSVVKLLLQRGADPNSKNLKGSTPLHLAGKECSKSEVISALLRRGGDAAAVNKAGDTPLHVAALNHSKQAGEIIRLLANASPECLHEKNYAGQLPADLAKHSRGGNFILTEVFEKLMKKSEKRSKSNSLALDTELWTAPHLKDVYVFINGLRNHLGISALKAAFVKQVLQKREVQDYAKKRPSKLQLFYQAICQVELRPHFEKQIDYSKLQEDVKQKKTETLIHSYCCAVKCQ